MRAVSAAVTTVRDKYPPTVSPRIPYDRNEHLSAPGRLPAGDGSSRLGVAGSFPCGSCRGDTSPPEAARHSLRDDPGKRSAADNERPGTGLVLRPAAEPVAHHRALP